MSPADAELIRKQSDMLLSKLFFAPAGAFLRSYQVRELSLRNCAAVETCELSPPSTFTI